MAMVEADNNPRSVKCQYFAAITGNLIALSFGAGVGWFSPALPLLLSSKSSLESGALTVEQISWIGSILSLGAIAGNLLAGFLISKIGSKATITFLGVPQLISWLLLIFGTEANHLNASRFFVGFAGGGGQIATSIYIAEIAMNDIRGRLGTIYHFNRRFGILFAYIVVSYFDYEKLAIFFVGLTILFYASFLWLPSTPQYLLKKNDIEAAETALKLYKGYDNEKNPSFISEMDQLKSVSNAVRDDDGIKLKDLLEPQAYKAIIQALVMALLTQVSATNVFLTYGTNIAKSSASTLSKETSTVTLGVVQMIGTYLASLFVDSKGRKYLLNVSTAGCSLSLICMSIHLYLHSYGLVLPIFDWIPILCMIVNMLFGSIGIVPLRSICLVESFPLEIRSFGVIFGNITLNIIGFLIIKTFPILSQIITLEGCLLAFGVSCAICIIYIVFCMDETKGKDLNVLKNDNLIKESAVAKVPVTTRV